MTNTLNGSRILIFRIFSPFTLSHIQSLLREINQQIINDENGTKFIKKQKKSLKLKTLKQVANKN